VWLLSHIAEVFELDLFQEGCPYFRKARARSFAESVVEDIAGFVNVNDDRDK
jgi:hypothetical protein